jgi:histidinol-phosphate aminotransferase
MAARIAVQDTKFIEDYVTEVLAARELLYVGLEQLKIPYIDSQANFVLGASGRPRHSHPRRTPRTRRPGA